MFQRVSESAIARVSVGLLVVLTLVVSGCKLKKDETDEPLKVPEKKASADATATASATPTASDSAAPATSAAASASAASSATTTPPEMGASGTAVDSSGIDKCCAALSAVQSSGVGKDSKKKSAAAALACVGISKLVKSGRTSRGAALVQVKAALAGASVPAACN
jgi:hypothetical protein